MAALGNEHSICGDPSAAADDEGYKMRQGLEAGHSLLVS